MKFDSAVRHILKHEGGLSDNPRDPGKLTKFGISLKAYPKLGEDGIRKLELNDAILIYKRDYWDAMKCDLLPPQLRLMTFDCAVNQGVGFAASALQGAVGARVDGDIGAKTLNAANAINIKDAVLKFAMLRFVRYLRNVNWRTFGEGWMSRLFHILLTTMETK